ncbi:MAG: hypothetical protein H7317_09495 [Pseudorhodobacter sp.]|nr:hypothetical protein [Pseudorhodobacter sp.]
MKIWHIGAISLLACAASPVWADKSDVLYQHKSWMVEGVTFDDGTYACLAEVTDPGESFSIWTFPDESVELQFYSEDWDFGESDTADMEVEVDRRSPWSMTGASLTGHSVLFTLPNNDQSGNFVIEVARGSTLHLRTANGDAVRDYTLAGSSASIKVLVDCMNSISGDSNPFN